MAAISNPIANSAFAGNFTTVIPSDVSPAALQDTSTKKKKRKRHFEGEGLGDGAEIKRKKLQKHRENITTVDIADAVDSSHAAEASQETPKKKKSKKREKEKDKEPTTADILDHDSDVDPNSQATALLSAIVAAAAATPDVTAAQHSQMLLQHPELVPQGQHQFLPYAATMQFDLGILPTFVSNEPHSSMMIPTPTNLSFSDLAFGSNEDVLRALQDIDMSKIASVLKTLGEAAAAANVVTYGTHRESESVPQTALGQIPAPSNAILGILPKGRGHRRTLDMSTVGNEQHTSPDHAYLLAHKWLNASKLAELVRTEGLVYKKGKFSAIEEEQLNSAIENYRIEKQVSAEELQDIIFPKIEKNRDNAFWSELTLAVPQRPIIAVYHHVRRTYHPWKGQGNWSPEQDALLKQAVAELGQQWEKVSLRVMRMSSDCRDRYRNHIHNRDIRVTGQWTKEEEVRLTQIVTEMTIKQGKDIDNDVFWGRVSELMGGTRGRQQCRIKWTDALSKTVKNEGQKPRWSQQDAFILVHKIDSLNVRDDTEIDWKTLSDPDWNLWSAHTLQRRWLTMKRGIKGFEDMTHQEIMDILRVKKAHLPSAAIPSTRKRKERKVTSAEAITEAGDSHTVASNGSGSSD